MGDGANNTPKNAFEIKKLEQNNKTEYSVLAGDKKLATEDYVDDKFDNIPTTTYEAGNGVSINNNTIGIKLDSTSEGFLTVEVDGIKLSGV